MERTRASERVVDIWEVYTKIQMEIIYIGILGLNYSIPKDSK